MRNHLLIAMTVATACVTAGSSAPDEDPLAMFAGTTGTVPATSTSVVNYCTFPILEVAAGVDITVSWENLDETIEGSPIDLSSETIILNSYEFSIPAEDVCAFSDWDDEDYESHSPRRDEEPPPPEVILSADQFTDGGATVFDFQVPEGSTHILRHAQLFLEPSSTSGVTSVELTSDAWRN